MSPKRMLKEKIKMILLFWSLVKVYLSVGISASIVRQKITHRKDKSLFQQDILVKSKTFPEMFRCGRIAIKLNNKLIRTSLITKLNQGAGVVELQFSKNRRESFTLWESMLVEINCRSVIKQLESQIESDNFLTFGLEERENYP